MFLYAVSHGIDFLVDHFRSLNLAKVTNKRATALGIGWKEPDFMFTDNCVFQTKRPIDNQQMFQYSKANMNPDAIALENKFHAKMKGAYSVVVKDPSYLMV